MSTLDPAVRDLLAAIYTALDGAELRDYPVCAVQTICRSIALYGRAAEGAAWLAGEVGELADAHRVRSADLYQATKEQLA
jgi:hypothetical protein